MDEVKIATEFMKNAISKLIRKLIRKKAGYDIDIKLNEINITFDDGKARIHLNADAELKRSELIKILKKIGLD